MDPFLGSGTTTLAAKNLNRNSVGYEINKEFLPNIKEKIGAMNQSFNFEFINQDRVKVDYKKEISNLTYIFKDTIKFKRKIDPKKLQFGSKIDSTKKEVINSYSVKGIMSPERLLLNNGLIVKLIGVKTKKDKTEEAIKFLQKKLKNQQVFIRFDSLKYDEKNNLLCYLYLRNKTFINAHLIRSKLVDVDQEFDYKYKLKFLNLTKYYA